MSQGTLLNWLITLTVSFLAGIVFGTYSPLRPGSLFYLFVGCFLLLASGYYIVESLRNRPVLRRTILVSSLILIAFLVGWGRYSYSLGEFRTNHVSDFTVSDWSRTATIVGTVVDQPTVNQVEARVVVKPTKIWPTQDAAEPIRVSGGKIMLRVSRFTSELQLGYARVSDNDIYGDRLKITGTLSELMSQRNPGTFSYKRYLSSKGIHGAVWGPEKLKRIEELSGNPVVAWALDLQTELLRVVKKTMPYPYSAFLGGSTLGLRGGLEFTETPFGTGERLISQEFKAAGTFHVLAVSGLHVGFVAAALLALFTGLRVPPEFYAPVILGSLLIFTIVTGARPATVRAAIMTGLIVIGMAYLKQGLKDSVLFGVMLAALFILLHRPRLIYEASFTLSFSAVFCLAVLTGPIEAILENIRDVTFLVFWGFVALTTAIWIDAWNWFFYPSVYLPYFLAWGGGFYVSHRLDQRYNVLDGFGFARIPTAISGFLAAQFAIQLGMMWPLSAYYFLKFPLAGGYVNLIAIPLVGVVVPLGIIAELIGLLPGPGEWLALVLNAGNFLAVSSFMWISHVAAKYFPYPAVRKFKIVHLLFLYGALAVLAWWRSLYFLTKRCWYWAADNVFFRLPVSPRYLVGSLITLAGVLLFGLTYYQRSGLDSVRVTVLDVGYGSAIGVRTPGGKNILINGGRRVWDWHNRGNRADRQDVGKLTVAPFFLNQRIKQLDLVVAQSPEPQYLGGFPYILKQFEIGRVAGPLAVSDVTPLNMRSYLDALDNSYYRSQRDAGWFRNDYYGGWKRFWKPIENRGIPYSRPIRGRVLHEERVELSGRPTKLILEVLHPPERTDYDAYASSNRSLVLSLRIGDELSILFPGDIRAAAQEDLTEYYSAGKLRHDVMIVPANGTAKSSVRRDFVRAVQPEFLIFSTGYPDIKGPLADKLQAQLSENWKQVVALRSEDKVFRTDRDYAIIVETRGQQFSIDTFAARHRD